MAEPLVTPPDDDQMDLDLGSNAGAEPDSTEPMNEESQVVREIAKITLVRTPPTLQAPSAGWRVASPAIPRTSEESITSSRPPLKLRIPRSSPVRIPAVPEAPAAADAAVNEEGQHSFFLKGVQVAANGIPFARTIEGFTTRFPRAMCAKCGIIGHDDISCATHPEDRQWGRNGLLQPRRLAAILHTYKAHLARNGYEIVYKGNA